MLTVRMGVFLPRRGAAEIRHQLDFDLGFYGAPEFAAGGFIREVRSCGRRRPGGGRRR